MSCDLLPTDAEGPHYQGSVLDVIDQDWDLIIAHPPCTYLTSTGARWLDDHRYPNRRRDMEEASAFFMLHINSRCPKVCVENPQGLMSSRYRKPDQYIQPWQFGHPVTKKTGLWLKGLPKLVPTNIVEPDPPVVFSSGAKMDKWFYETSCLPHEDRAKARSKTFQGIADAMAEQWG